jgi:hypothetical protein
MMEGSKHAEGDGVEEVRRKMPHLNGDWLFTQWLSMEMWRRAMLV